MFVDQSTHIIIQIFFVHNFEKCLSKTKKAELFTDLTTDTEKEKKSRKRRHRDNNISSSETSADENIYQKKKRKIKPQPIPPTALKSIAYKHSENLVSIAENTHATAISNKIYYQSRNKNIGIKTRKNNSFDEESETDFNTLQNSSTFTRNDISSPSPQHSKEDITSHNSSLSINFDKQVYSSTPSLQFAKIDSDQSQENTGFKKKLYSSASSLQSNKEHLHTKQISIHLNAAGPVLSDHGINDTF